MVRSLDSQSIFSKNYPGPANEIANPTYAWQDSTQEIRFVNVRASDAYPGL